MPHARTARSPRCGTARLSRWMPCIGSPPSSPKRCARRSRTGWPGNLLFRHERRLRGLAVFVDLSERRALAEHLEIALELRDLLEVVAAEAVLGGERDERQMDEGGAIGEGE